MDAEARRIKEEIKNLPFKEKMSNYWHYYKIHFFVAVACAIALGTSIVQCATRVDPDMAVAVYLGWTIGDDEITQFAELLKAECVDIDGDGEVYVKITPSVADIANESMDQMTMTIFERFQAELAANAYAGYVLDEEFKNLMVDAYKYPKENVIEISSISEIKECLKIADGEKLYWLSGFAEREKDEVSQFNNSKRTEEFLRAKLK